MSGPLRQDIAHLDFTVTCSPPKFLGQQQPECVEPAQFFAEFHMTGRCTHPACNERGNLEFLVCAAHLRALDASADRTIRKLHPPSWLGWFRPDPYEGRCPTCRRHVQTTSDIVQIVRGILQGGSS